MSVGKVGLTIEEAAETTGIGRNTMRKLVDWGKLPVLKVGRKTIIRKDALERFMEANKDETFWFRTMCGRSNEYPLRSPRRLSAKYTPRTNLTICSSGISPCREPVSAAAAAPKTAQLHYAVA